MEKTTDPPVQQRCKPLRRDAELNRAKILAAASTVFAKDGLDVALEQIAEQAGVGIATMYRRFPCKDELIGALFRERIDLVISAAEECLEYDDAWEGLVAFLERAQALFAADRGLVDAVFESADGGPEGLCIARQRLRPLTNRLVERAQEQGKLRSDLDPTDLPMLQLMMSMVIRYTGEVAPGVWARYLGIILDGLRTQRRRPTTLNAAPLTAEQVDVALATGGVRRSTKS